MRPPICEVCGDEAAKLIEFGDFAPLPEGKVGHPRGLGWFCSKHALAASAWTELPMADAIRRAKGGGSEEPPRP